MTLCVRYDVTAIMPELSYGYVFKTVDFNKKRKIYVERRPLGPETALVKNEIELLKESFLAQKDVIEGDDRIEVLESRKAEQQKIAKLCRFESYPYGLADYY